MPVDVTENRIARFVVETPGAEIPAETDLKRGFCQEESVSRVNPTFQSDDSFSRD
jgi:hypothetical protein